MRSLRFPVGDGRDVVISWKMFDGRAYVRVGPEILGEATFHEMRRGHSFFSAGGEELRVFALTGFGWPMFDVYYGTRLLPGSMAERRTARRTMIELLAFVAAIDVGSLHGPPAGLTEWLHAGFALAALATAIAVWRKAPAAVGLAKNFMLIRVIVSLAQAGTGGFVFTIDLGTIGLYVWIQHLAKALESRPEASAGEPVPAAMTSG